MTYKNFKNLLPIVLLAFAIAISPSFPIGNLVGGRPIEIRFEDILILILGFIWIVSFLISGKRKIEKPPLFFPILTWLGIGFISVLFNWMLGNLDLSKGFFYFLKEIEFFLFYFFVFYHLKTINSAKIFIKIWIFLMVLNIGYVVYQILNRLSFGEYGTAALCEWGVFPTGGFFIIPFIFLFNIFLYYFLNLNISRAKKIICGLAIMILVIGVFGSLSKTCFLGLMLAGILTFLLLILRKPPFRLVLMFFLMLFFIISIIVFFFGRITTDNREVRLLYIFSFDNIIHNFTIGRLELAIKPTFEDAISKKDPMLYILGFGKGYIGEAHNQYLRNFIETGIKGSLIFLFLIWLILKKSFQVFLTNKDPFLNGLSAGLLISTLIMLFFSIVTEPFIVVKVSEVYWVFTAITMAVLFSINKERKLKIKSMKYEF